MSKYTVRLKDILDNYYYYKNQPEMIEKLIYEPVTSDEWINNFDTEYKTPFERDKYPRVDEIIEATWEELFNFDYTPLKDVPRGELEKKFIKKYYMREIGFETIERFKLALNESLNRIMPYYNDLLDSVKMSKENPLSNYEFYDSSTRNTDNTSNITNTNKEDSNGESKSIFEDTPSNELSPDTNYATNITKGTGSNHTNGTSNSDSNSNTEDIYNRYAHGIMGMSKQDLIARYRDNLINVEELIIIELRDLFMLLY